MKINATAAAHLSGKSKVDHLPNPAQQAKAAEPGVKGAEFGALVSSIARAKHAGAAEAPPVAPPVTPPATEGTGVIVDVEV